MPRLNFTAATKRRAHKRSNGICECHLIPWLGRPNGCGSPLGIGNTYYEHVNPDNIRHDSTIENCAVLVKTCWREKTDRFDRKVIAKSNHNRDAARGIFQKSYRPLPGGRDDPRKRTMSGQVVNRETGEKWSVKP